MKSSSRAGMLGLGLEQVKLGICLCVLLLCGIVIFIVVVGCVWYRIGLSISCSHTVRTWCIIIVIVGEDVDGF
jgi:hypothetical protein